MNKNVEPLKFAVVIPARYESTRFPGKPLVDILGKPMIQHVWERCCNAVPIQSVYIATDNQAIKSVCESFGAQVVLTSNKCLTGTDRLAEMNEIFGFDFIVNVQGDEPLINPNDIKSIISAYIKSPNEIVNAMCKITNESDFRSPNIPKVATSNSNKLLYMSRSPIPTTKSNAFITSYKQVCIYAFSKEHLDFFYQQGEKSAIEAIEDIEILRFLEHDIPVRMVEVSGSSIAVDIPGDVGNVILALSNETNDY